MIIQFYDFPISPPDPSETAPPIAPARHAAADRRCNRRAWEILRFSLWKMVNDWIFPMKNGDSMGLKWKIPEENGGVRMFQMGKRWKKSWN